MITTDVISLAFSGDGLAKSFDVQIEGIPIAPDGADHFAVSRRDGEGEMRILRYGIDYSYAANIVNGFSNSFVLTLNDPLPEGESLIVARTTPILSIAYYPENKTPPKQVEADIDNVIKILQELGYRIKGMEKAIDAERDERIAADEDLQAQIDRKVDVANGVAKHNWTHFRNGGDPVTPDDIGALIQAPATGRPYLASTTRQGVTMWVEYFEGEGEISATTVAQNVTFEADGTSTEYEIPHTLNTLSVVVAAYDCATGKRVYFPSHVKDEHAVILAAKSPPARGRAFRVFIQGQGKINPEYFQGQIQIDVGAPATEWRLVHHLHNRKPNVRIFNPDETEIPEFTVDWPNATPDEISVSFPTPKRGFAILDGWVNVAPASFIPPTYTFIQNTPSTVWHIEHRLNVMRPTIIALNERETVVNPQIDYENATVNAIDLVFSAPVMGTAVVKV